VPQKKTQNTQNLKNENVIYISNGVLFFHKKNEMMSLAGKWMELEIIMLSKVSQVQKDKSCMFSLICGS
jgi:hypothetical protein